MKSRGEIRVGQDTPGLRQSGQILPQELPGRSISVKNKATPWNIELGDKLLRVWARIVEPSICYVSLPWLQNHMGL